jgi:hypothetical protein
VALNGSNLSAAVRAAIAGVSDKSDHDAVWDAIGQAIVTYITTNAVVSTAVTGTCPTGAVAGTGTGTVA